MTMTTIFFRFPDESTALKVFSAVTGTEVTDISLVPSKVNVSGYLCDVDPIGPIYKVIGENDDGSYQVTKVDGWHVNIWMPSDGILPQSVIPFQIFPVTPERLFA